MGNWNVVCSLEFHIKAALGSWHAGTDQKEGELCSITDGFTTEKLHNEGTQTDLISDLHSCVLVAGDGGDGYENMLVASSGFCSVVFLSEI